MSARWDRILNGWWPLGMGLLLLWIGVDRLWTHNYGGYAIWLDFGLGVPNFIIGRRKLWPVGAARELLSGRRPE